MARLVLVLLVLALVRPAAAAERPAADDMGKLLAYTINCTCVVGEKDWILDVYRRIFADAYGEAYAQAIEAPLQGALKDGWDRHMDLCERLCDQPVTRELQLALARADGGPVDASGVREVLGPPPANEPAVVAVSPGSGEAVTLPAAAGVAQGAAVAAVPEEQGRTAFAPQPNYCIYRAYAKGCTPPEEEALIVIAPPPAFEQDMPALPVGAADGQTDGAPDAASADTVAAVPEAAAVEEVEAVAAPQAEVVAAEDAGETAPPDYFETAGTGDNWSSALCRTSPSKPECRKAGGS